MNVPTQLTIRLLKLNIRIHDRYSVLGYSIVFFVTGLFCTTVGLLARWSIDSAADIIGGILFIAVGYRYLTRFLKTSK